MFGAGRGKEQPAQCCVEFGGAGFVLAGSERSIRLTLEDAVLAREPEVFFLAASGEPVRLAVLDGAGARVPWVVRAVTW